MLTADSEQIKVRNFAHRTKSVLLEDAGVAGVAVAVAAPLEAHDTSPVQHRHAARVSTPSMPPADGPPPQVSHQVRSGDRQRADALLAGIDWEMGLEHELQSTFFGR